MEAKTKAMKPGWKVDNNLYGSRNKYFSVVNFCAINEIGIYGYDTIDELKKEEEPFENLIGIWQPKGSKQHLQSL